MLRYLMYLAFAVGFLVAANVRADVVSSLTFELTSWKDFGSKKGNDLKVPNLTNEFGFDAKNAFSFVFTPGENNTILLTFDYSAYVKDNNLQNIVNGGKDDLKVDSFGLKGDWGILVDPGKASLNGKFNPLTATLQLKSGYDWGDFVDFVTSDDFAGQIGAHVKSIGRNNDSINEGIFTYAPPVPEPATLAVLGLGLAGLGVARARRRK